ncbi:septum formation initiator family protein [Anaerobacillus sp. HL2]|nr:septum formation initiator family protein [Anaerobacillus sp. HL2]
MKEISTDEIKNLNDLEYISEIARRDYYLTKPGEIIFKVPAIFQIDTCFLIHV